MTGSYQPEDLFRMHSASDFSRYPKASCLLLKGFNHRYLYFKDWINKIHRTVIVTNISFYVVKNTFTKFFFHVKGAFTSQFSDSFFNYGKTRFHVNGVNNYFIILCIFLNISFWRQSIFFPSLFWNQNRLGFKKILGTKSSDKSIVSKRGWKRNKGKPTSQFL